MAYTSGVCTLVEAQTGKCLNLRYVFVKKEFGMWQVQVYSDYWIINKTGDDLVYVRRE